MTLNRLLSKPPASDFQQVNTIYFSEEGELELVEDGQENGDYELSDEDEQETPILAGQYIALETGTISLNYYCTDCDDTRTFNSDEKQGLHGIAVNHQIVSIDCVLKCVCGAAVHAWYLIEAECDFRNQSPKIRILHFREKLSEGVKLQSEQYGKFAEWLEKANRANRDGLGSGAVIYLRKVFESVTYDIAKTNNISITHENGNRRKFNKILQEVNEKHAIIPATFSENGYALFSELSKIIHGDGSEEDALKYFGALRTLVTGVLDNIKQKDELRDAVQQFNWTTN